MSNRILIAENWQTRIRDKMGVDIAYLPDSTIEQKDIIAVVLECCILLCPSMSARLPKKESGPHAGHELYVNWDNKKLEFIDDRNNLVGKILDQVSPTLSSQSNNFRVTYPKRGW
ncbi:hypothetical protein [Tissierella sp.]|uniref:hypothetical protein n=1 Tax=Tissierella sp. TaxID=41274 RepID=UPI002854DE8F|nr:hypothetical protein [Tissierella sp.]MDR7856086.1 hypothetical protein [Tissierella sp.]